MKSTFGLLIISAIIGFAGGVITEKLRNRGIPVIRCPTCKGKGFTPNIFNPKIKVPCILCNGLGKIHR